MAVDPPSRPRGLPSAHDQGTAPVNELADEFGRVARTLEAEDDLDAMLDELVASAVRMVPGADGGSISMATRRQHVTSEHPSGELAARLDAIQSEVGEGPCLEAVFEEQTVRVPDLRHEQRWPRFARRALEAGAGGMLSIQLYVEGDNLGALNLYSLHPGAFDDESEQIGLLFASHAAVAFASAQKKDNFASALAGRDLIGQAKGILMERYDVDGDQAFRVLVRVSQSRHRKLRDVATELITSRKLNELQS